MSRRLKSSLLIFVLAILAVVVLPPQLIPSVHAIPSYVSTVDSGASNRGVCSPCNVVLPAISVTANDIIVTSCGGTRCSTAPLSVTDTQGNTYTQANAGVSSLSATFTAKMGSTGSTTITWSYTANVAGKTDFVASDYTAVSAVGVTANSGQIAGSSSVTITAGLASSLIILTDGGSDSTVADACNYISTPPSTNTRVHTCLTAGTDIGEDNTSGDSAATGSSQTFSDVTNANFNHVITAVELKAVLVPAITSVSPSAGVNGQSITVTGTNLNGATKITFCGDNQGVFTVVSSTSITTFAPNRNPVAGGETCDILVTSSAGTSAVVTADQFTYLGGSSNLSGYGGVPVSWYAYGTFVAVIFVGGAAFLMVKGRRKQ